MRIFEPERTGVQSRLRQGRGNDPSDLMMMFITLNWQSKKKPKVVGELRPGQDRMVVLHDDDDVYYINDDVHLYGHFHFPALLPLLHHYSGTLPKQCISTDDDDDVVFFHCIPDRTSSGFCRVRS